MRSGWQQIYSTDKRHLIEIVKALLEENNIESFEVDKQDSTYITLGEIELYVKSENVVLAKFLIEKNSL